MSYWQDKVVLITGGAAGLGRCLATHYARAGAALVLADRDEAALERAASELGSLTGRVEGIRTDITDQESVDGLFSQVEQHFPRLDALVNCAGRSGRGAILDTSVEKFQSFLELNFFAAVRCTRAAAPRLLESRGHIVNIGSLAAKMASFYLSGYPVSKFAVAAYSQQLRLELGPPRRARALGLPGPAGSGGRRGAVCSGGGRPASHGSPGRAAERS